MVDALCWTCGLARPGMALPGRGVAAARDDRDRARTASPGRPLRLRPPSRRDHPIEVASAAAFDRRRATSAGAARGTTRATQYRPSSEPSSSIATRASSRWLIAHRTSPFDRPIDYRQPPPLDGMPAGLPSNIPRTLVRISRLCRQAQRDRPGSFRGSNMRVIKTVCGERGR